MLFIFIFEFYIKITLMKIYQNDSHILHSSINFNYFNKDQQTSQQYFTESYWNNGDEGTSVLTYSIFYSLKDQNTNAYLIRYEKRLVLKCLIENLDDDIYDIIKIKETMNNSIGSFLKQISLPSNIEINFIPLSFSEKEVLREKQSIERLKELHS